MTGTFKCYCSKAERSFHMVGSSGSLGICRVRWLRAQRQARTGHTAVRWVHRCPGPALGSRSFESQVPLRSSGKLCTFGQMNPTQHVCLLCSPWDPTEDSFLVHFTSLCCGGGKDWRRDASGFSFYAKRKQTHRAGPRAQLTERDQAGTCPQRCPIVHGPVLPRRWGQGVGPEGVFKPIVSEWRSSHPKEGDFQWLVNSSLNFAG